MRLLLDTHTFLWFFIGNPSLSTNARGLIEDESTNLPFHHRDPFDRLIIGQALTEQMQIVSADVAFDHYAVSRLW